MVPNASDDLPDPDTPVNTTSTSRGTSTSTARRLFSRAPRTRANRSRAAVAVVGCASSTPGAGCRGAVGMVGQAAPDRPIAGSIPQLKRCDQRARVAHWRNFAAAAASLHADGAQHRAGDRLATIGEVLPGVALQLGQAL